MMEAGDAQAVQVYAEIRMRVGTGRNGARSATLIWMEKVDNTFYRRWTVEVVKERLK